MKAEYPNFVPLVKPSKGFKELNKLIVEGGFCSLCGGCTALCDRLELSEDGPRLKEDQQCNLDIGAITCGLDGSCYDACPMVPFSWKELEKQAFGKAATDTDLGVYQEIIAVRSKDTKVLEKAQDGGAVTSLLLAGLEENLLDGAVITSRRDDWKPESKIVTKREEILESAGTKYARFPLASLSVEALRQGMRSIGLVGTGCQNTAIRRLLAGSLKNIPNVDVTSIGLFCFENFPYDDIKELFNEFFGVEMTDILKQDISKGKFILSKADGSQISKNVREFDAIVPKVCEYCTNFTSKLSDLSVGSIGSPDGWSTVIVRSSKGKALLAAAVKLKMIELTENVDIEAIRKNVSLKRKKRAKIEDKDSCIPSFE